MMAESLANYACEVIFLPVRHLHLTPLLGGPHQNTAIMFLLFCFSMQHMI